MFTFSISRVKLVEREIVLAGREVMGQTQGLVVGNNVPTWCSLDCKTRLLAATLDWVLLHHKTILNISLFFHTEIY